MSETKISYVKYSANAWRGCAKVASGCTNCYAAVLANRFPAIFGKWGTEKQGGVRVVADLGKLFRQVRRWDKQAACCCPALVNEYGLTFQAELHLRGCPQADGVRVFWNDVSDFFED